MDEKKLAQYASVKASIATLEKEAAELKKSIEESMLAEGKDLIPSVFGEFKMQGRKSWVYPANVMRLEEQCEVARVEAQERGTATFTEKKGLYFIPTKI